MLFSLPPRCLLDGQSLMLHYRHRELIMVTLVMQTGEYLSLFDTCTVWVPSPVLFGAEFTSKSIYDVLYKYELKYGGLIILEPSFVIEYQILPVDAMPPPK